MPRGSNLIPWVLQEFHAGIIRGHSGFLRTYRRIIAGLYWSSMKNDIRKFVESCEACQRNKLQSLSLAGLLLPLPVLEQIWEDITMNFIEGLPKSQGFSVILVVVDRLTKFAHFIPLKHPFLASTVVVMFIKELVRLQRIPRSIILDRDKIFISHFWKELLCLQGTQLKRNILDHLQTNGQTEVVNRCVETYLRCFSVEKPKTW